VTPFLLFDAYGTLVELDDFYGRLQRGFAAHGLELPLGVVRQAARQEMHYYIQHAVRARDLESWQEVRRECSEVLIGAVREQGHQVALSPEAALQVLGDAVVFRAFPDTEAALEKLHHEGIPMGVLSNWDYQLSDILDQINLGRYFAFILSSSQIGVEKPSPIALARGLEAARSVQPDLTAAQCYYIGDHYAKDVVPARTAGMTPVWLVRDERDVASGDKHEDADVLRIGSLCELGDVIGV
jgi:HAD superfamily hydrolase (TIGR01549 family)